MSWYYAEGGRATGPISTDEFDLLIMQGRISPGTLVWQKGMSNWQPLESLNRSVPEIILPLDDPMASEASATRILGDPVISHVNRTLNCAECGRSGSVETFASGRNVTLCRECLLTLQKGLSTGSVPARSGQETEVTPSPIPARIGAMFLDTLVFLVLMNTLLYVFVDHQTVLEARNAYDRKEFEAFVEKHPAFLTVSMQVMTAVLAFAFFYHAMLNYGLGGSLGKRMLGLKVVSSLDNSRISFQQSSIRAMIPTLIILSCAFISVAFGLTLFLFGYFSAFYDPMRRTWYDHLAKTRVIKDK